MAYLGWHFLPADRKLRHGDGRTVRVGETLTCERAVPCAQGLHASERVRAAWGYYSGAILCRVELGDDAVTDGDKAVSRSRRCLDMRRVTTGDMGRLYAAIAPARAAFGAATATARAAYDAATATARAAYDAATATAEAAYDAATATAEAAYDAATATAGAAYDAATAPAGAAYDAATATAEAAWYESLPRVED